MSRYMIFWVGVIAVGAATVAFRSASRRPNVEESRVTTFKVTLYSGPRRVGYWERVSSFTPLDGYMRFTDEGGQSVWISGTYFVEHE